MISYNSGADMDCKVCGKSVKSKFNEGSEHDSFWYKCDCGNFWSVATFDIFDNEDDEW